MKNNSPGGSFWPIGLVFAVTSVFFIVARNQLSGAWNVNPYVLLVGNLILFAATAVSYLFYSRTLRNNNPQVFLRMMYASLLVKMMLCLLATFLYLFLAGGKISKGAVLGCFGLYIVYTVLEVKILMRLIRNLPKNA